jgi:hypothetical protein
MAATVYIALWLDGIRQGAILGHHLLSPELGCKCQQMNYTADVNALLLRVRALLSTQEGTGLPHTGQTSGKFAGHIRLLNGHWMGDASNSYLHFEGRGIHYGEP